jgi:hypothetical protein
MKHTITEDIQIPGTDLVLEKGDVVTVNEYIRYPDPEDEAEKQRAAAEDYRDELWGVLVKNVWSKIKLGMRVDDEIAVMFSDVMKKDKSQEMSFLVDLMIELMDNKFTLGYDSAILNMNNTKPVLSPKDKERYGNNFIK